ncbi:MAG: MlaD family protein [Archangium sp.]
MTTGTPPVARTSPAGKERRSAIRAGVFVLVALGLGAAVLIVLGNAHRVFERHDHYFAYFGDVDGLTIDSPVRLGGLRVGTVEEITFSEALSDTRVRVAVKVSRDFSSRVRTDSIARVSSRGVLGDKTIDISLGSEAGEPVKSGGELKAGVGGDITSVLKASGTVVDNIVSISNDVRIAIAAFTTPEFRGEVTGAVTNLHDILRATAKGDGALHEVIYEPRTRDDLRALLASATQTAKRLDGAVAKVDAILEEVRSGDGTAHALFYGTEGKRALDELGNAASQVTTLLDGVKSSEKGAAHALLYGDSKALVDDLSESAANLKRITDKVAKGEGSLGALINDPTAYEDLKTILGNVKRNRLLRELVRLSISNRSEYERTGEPSTPVTEKP